MPLFHLGRAPFVLLALPVVLAVACTPPPATLAESDLATIRADTDEWTSLAEAGDWAAVAALYSSDAVIMPPNESAVQGRAGIQETLASFPSVTSAEFTIDDIQGVGDLAYVRASYAMSMSLGDQTIEDRGKYLEIRRRQADGSWPIVVDIWNSDIPLPTAGQEGDM